MSPSSVKPLKLVQITDCHLQNDPAQLYRELDVEVHFDRVLEQAVSHAPDMLLLTGDLVHHGGPQGYQRLHRKLSSLSVPCYWIPGNHDDADLMQQIGGDMNLRSVSCGRWGIVLLDSSSEPDGRGSGSLAQQELDFLSSQLQQCADKQMLVVLHHNPLPVNSGWQDPIMLANADAFWQIIDAHPNVRAVLCGHVHQQWRLERKGVDLYTTPASSVQFKPGCDDFTLEDRNGFTEPAFRVLELSDQGKIETRVIYL